MIAAIPLLLGLAAPASPCDAACGQALGLLICGDTTQNLPAPLSVAGAGALGALVGPFAALVLVGAGGYGLTTVGIPLDGTATVVGVVAAGLIILASGPVLAARVAASRWVSPIPVVIGVLLADIVLAGGTAAVFAGLAASGAMDPGLALTIGVFATFAAHVAGTALGAGVGAGIGSATSEAE